MPLYIFQRKTAENFSKIDKRASMHIHLLCIEGSLPFYFHKLFCNFFFSRLKSVSFWSIARVPSSLISITWPSLHLAAILQFQLQTILIFIFTNSISSFKTVDHNFCSYVFSFSCSVATVMLIPSLIKITVPKISVR